MTHLNQGFLAAACLLIALSAMVAIFHPDYDDTFLQRLGLCLAASGSVVVCFQLWIDGVPTRAVELTLLGSGIYGMGTCLKIGLPWLKRN